MTVREAWILGLFVGSFIGSLVSSTIWAWLL